MSTFPESLNLIIVDDVFEHYELGYDRDESAVFVYCDRCDGIVCAFDYDDIESSDETLLYEKIIDSHRKV